MMRWAHHKHHLCALSSDLYILLKCVTLKLYFELQGCYWCFLCIFKDFIILEKCMFQNAMKALTLKS